MDEADEYTSLIEEIRSALATLEEPGDGVGTAGAYAFETDSALAPDEILERAEEEQAREREEM